MVRGRSGSAVIYLAMRALTFQAEGEVKVTDVPKPSIKGASDALVKVTLGAVCGSDLHILHGHTPINQGAVLGHEFVGVVEDVGAEVKRFKPGDRVVSSFFTSCGHCALCRKGWFNQCVDKATFGHGEYFGDLGGGQAEYVVVPLADHSMEPIPAGMTDEQAIFVGDILATGFFGAERAEIKPGDVIAVVGAGPVGLMATMCAQLFGPARTFVIDMVDSRLEVAQELGGIPINSKRVHPVQAIEAETDGIGADSSFFFQAEDGIRDYKVTGVQTCALPISKAIGFAILFDSLDGRLARLLKANTDFGVQFDSLADVVSFGIAPAILAYAWGLRDRKSVV